MEQAVNDKKAVAAKKRKETRLRRERAKLDEMAALWNAKQEGFAEGLAIAEFLKKVVRNMHEAGFCLADIVKVSELSENEVKGILKTLNEKL